MSKLALAIDLGGTNLRGALVTREGSIQEQASSPVASDRSAAGVLNQILQMIDQLRSLAKNQNQGISAVGIGVPGFVNAKEGLVYSSPNYSQWNCVPLGKSLSEKLPQLTFSLENDANAAVIGEWWMGCAQGFRNVILLTLGTGIGGGVLVENQLIAGTSGGANELGHIVVEPEGPRCGCGGRGCLEQLASGGGLKRNLGHSTEDLFYRAEKHDSQALEVFHNMGRYLGIGITSLCYVFDPEIVVLGGRVSRAFPFFEKGLRTELAARLAKHPAKNAKIVPAKCGDDAGLLGAAYNAFARLDTKTESAKR